MIDFIKRHRLWQAVIVLVLLATLYWGLVASDRYVSEAHVMVEQTDITTAPATDFTSLLAGKSGNARDQLLLRDYLLSVDMMRKLDARLKLREHYSSNGDLLSRMWFKDASLEWFHRHYLSRVRVEFDDYTGLLVVRAQAYTPEMANSIARSLIEEGERFMNEMGHRLALSQVGFIEKQIALSGKRFTETRNALLAYQNAHNLVSPTGTLEARSSLVSQLEAQVSELRARRRAMASYLAPGVPDLKQVDMQIQGLESQIAAEKARLASPGKKSLNVVSEQYERLQMDAMLAQDQYKTALAALEKIRVDSTRTLKKLSILQNPTFPQYPLEPRRLYNIVTFAVITLLLAGIVHMMSAIIRDHRD